MKRRILKSVVAGLVALAAYGAAPADAQSQRIRIFAGSSPVFAPVFVADQRGFFKAEGLDVQVRPFSSGAEATEGFRSGSADFLVASDVPLIYLLVGGDTTMLAQFSANRDMLVMVGPKGTAGPADLKGKKIGLVTRSSSEYLLHQYLKRAGFLQGPHVINHAGACPQGFPHRTARRRDRHRRRAPTRPPARLPAAPPEARCRGEA